MLLFFAEGQLGNQLFQYVFLKTVQKKNETLIVSGFEELQEVFEVDGFIPLNRKNRWLRYFLYRIARPVLTLFANMRVISSISINRQIVLDQYERDLSSYSFKKGLINSLIFVKTGVFHSEQFFNTTITNQLSIKTQYLTKAESFLNPVSMYANKVFVHIRRGDYKSYTVFGKSPLLPLDYYKKKINWFIKNRENCIFIFLSDEPERIEEEFDYLPNKLISYRNHFGTDLAIMIQCNHAILSPSSFGWWGAYLIPKKGIVFAPEYWLGFNDQIEYPANAIPDFMKKVPVA